MLKLAYNVSDELRNSLTNIEALRRSILVTPLPPKFEFRLSWNAMVERCYSTLALTNSPLTRADVVKLLLLSSSRRLLISQQAVVGYRRAFDLVSQEWLANPKPLTLNVIYQLAEAALPAQPWRRGRE